MRQVKEISLCLLLIIVLIYSGLSYLTDIFTNSTTLNFIMLLLLIIIGIIVLSKYLRKSSNSLNSENKLFNSLVNNSDTIYIMIEDKTKRVLYVSNKIEEILGIKTGSKSLTDIAYQVLRIPVIKSELLKFNDESYTSGMIEYDNPKYNHPMWIRVKISPYKDKKNEYYLIQIIDATLEHEHQHLLITQASDIKSRESILNQITSKSYDFALNVNVALNTYDLKYYKKDNLYFGEEKRGLYTEGLNKLLDNINESDREMVYSNLNLESLLEHFNKYELDSVVIRYRVGNEIKNSTWLESTIFFVTERQKQIVSILTKNVTENAESIREQNILLQNALNDAKISNARKLELIRTISHDVRVPLTNIVGLSDALLYKTLDKEVKEDIKNINDSSKEVVDIIDELLDTSKIEKKLIEKEEKEYSLLKMFKKVERNAKEYIGEKQIKLNINLDNNLPVILFGDYIRITRAINEIVNNSIKYTNEGSIDVNVRGEKIENNVKLIIEVKDTGVGIEEEKLKKIINTETSGGLNSVKNLINLLGGKLEIESKINEYTKVTISFLQRIVEDNKVRELMNSDKNAEQFSLKGKKVLIVDDNKLNLKVTNRLLEAYEVDTTMLESGEECIELINEQNNFDLILLDQMMPGIKGTETMNKLKEIKDFNTPIVVLTADAMEGQREKYINEGFDDYLSKPIDRKELVRILKRFLKEG